MRISNLPGFSTISFAVVRSVPAKSISIYSSPTVRTGISLRPREFSFSLRISRVMSRVSVLTPSLNITSPSLPARTLPPTGTINVCNSSREIAVRISYSTPSPTKRGTTSVLRALERYCMIRVCLLVESTILLASSEYEISDCPRPKRSIWRPETYVLVVKVTVLPSLE